MRKITVLKGGWRFLKAGLSLEQALASAEQGEQISLPHTWNAVDGQDGGNDYHRGTCWYVRELTEKELTGDHVFLEINGAAMSADVWFNNRCLCHHDGGYSTFRAELPRNPAGQNVLAIVISNEDNDKVYPQKADFTFYGGLYREVRLISVPEEHFELLKDGTPGIKVTPIVDLENRTAAVTVETWQNASFVTMTVNGESRTVPSAEGHARAEFILENVHLWDGTEDPWLYTATARLESGDEISARFGCREFRCDPEKGFFLNGRSLPLSSSPMILVWLPIWLTALRLCTRARSLNTVPVRKSSTVRLILTPGRCFHPCPTLIPMSAWKLSPARLPT